jgi:hypothetical protein
MNIDLAASGAEWKAQCDADWKAYKAEFADTFLFGTGRPGRPKSAATAAQVLITEIRNIQASKKCLQAEAFRHYAKINGVKVKSVERAYRRAKTLTKL